MERLSALLFELANVDRLAILTELNKSATKLTNLAKGLDLTVQETSRHLQRLIDALLVQKLADGAFHITHHGTLILMLLPGLDFLTEHRDYFVQHQTSHVPASFISRVGELSGSTLLDNPVLAFQKVNAIIEEAKEELLMTADQVPSGSVPLIEAAVKRGVSLLSIMPVNMQPPDIPDAYMPSYEPEELDRIRVGRIDEVATVSVISEKAAVVGFPTLDGKMDYAAFYTETEAGLKWCRDLFMHYWSLVNPKHPLED
jgi:predicted transcriptional regulator